MQHCFICRPSDSTVSENAGIEPRTVATIRHLLSDALTTRLDLTHYYSAKSHPLSARSPPLSARSHPLSAIDLISNSARSHPLSARSHPLSARSHPVSNRSHPLSARSHPLSARSHRRVFPYLVSYPRAASPPGRLRMRTGTSSAQRALPGAQRGP
jgi:hypothetical protein